MTPEEKAARIEELRKKARIAELRQKAQAAPALDPVSAGIPAPVDFDSLEMLKNIPSSGAKMVGDMANTIMHPIDTISGLNQMLAGIGQKLSRNASQLMHGDEMESAGFDAEWNKGDKEANADAVGQFVVDRYGSIDNLKKTIMEDPVGVLVDAASVLSGTGAALRGTKAGQIATKAGAALEPVNAASNLVKYGGGKVIPKKLPHKLYEETAKFSTVKGTKNRAALVDRALDKQLPPTPAGFEKLESRMAVLRDEADRLVDSVPPDQLLDATAVKKHLTQLKQEKGGFKVNAKSDTAYIDQKIAELDAAIDAQGGKVTARQMHEFKKDTQDLINYDKKQLQGTKVGDDTLKAIATAAKEAVEDAVPGIKGVNAEMSQLLDLKGPLEKAAARIGNRDLLHFMAPMNTTAGAYLSHMMGLPPEVGALVGAGVSAAVSPKAKGHLAIQLAQGKKNARLGRFVDNNPTTAQARLSAALAGRLTENSQ